MTKVVCWISQRIKTIWIRSSTRTTCAICVVRFMPGVSLNWATGILHTLCHKYIYYNQSVYRSTGETLSKRQFHTHKEAVREQLFPTRKPHVLISAGLDSAEPLLNELQIRERANRFSSLSTIIYLRHHTKTGYEISGYIDFEQSIREAIQQLEGCTDWYGIFKENKRLWPKPSDLGYYHWRSGRSVINNTDNYKVQIRGKLVFIH